MKKIIASALILSMLSAMGSVCFAKDESEELQNTPMTLEYIDPDALPDESTVEEPELDADDASSEDQRPADEEAQVEEDVDSEYSEAPEAEDEQEEKEAAKDLPLGTRIKNWFKNDVANFFKNDVKNFIKNNFEWLVVGTIAVASLITVVAVSSGKSDKKEKTPEEKAHDKAKDAVEILNQMDITVVPVSGDELNQPNQPNGGFIINFGLKEQQQQQPKEDEKKDEVVNENN